MLSKVKRCSKCFEEKEYSAFSVNRKTKSGRCSSCKKCDSLRHKQNYEKDPDYFKRRSANFRKQNPESCRRGAARWREKNPESPEVVRARQLKQRYNLTLEAFTLLETQQNGVCAICANRPNKLYVDHDHKTGKIRGLLCRNCNTGLGCFSDASGLLIKASKYLQQ